MDCVILQRYFCACTWFCGIDPPYYPGFVGQLETSIYPTKMQEQQVHQPRWQRRLDLRRQTSQFNISLPKSDTLRHVETRPVSLLPHKDDARSLQDSSLKENHPGEILPSRAVLEQGWKDQISSQPGSPVISICSESTVFNFPVPPSRSVSQRNSRQCCVSSPESTLEKHNSSITPRSTQPLEREKLRRSSSADSALPQLPAVSRTQQMIEPLKSRLSVTERVDDSDCDTLCSQECGSDKSEICFPDDDHLQKPRNLIHPACRQSLYQKIMPPPPRPSKRYEVSLSSEFDLWM